jgi:hypothetical protein
VIWADAVDWDKAHGKNTDFQLKQTDFDVDILYYVNMTSTVERPL